MDKVERVINLRQEIERYRDTIKNSYSDWEINQAVELLEIRADELDSLEASLNDDELVMLDHYYLMESHPLSDE